MKEIKSSSVQLIITNPPLFFSKCNFSNSGLPQDFESYVKELRRVFKECNRVLESGRYICINFRGSAEDAFPPAQFLISLKEAGFEYCDDLIWNKKTLQNGKQPPTILDHSLIFCKGKVGKSEFERKIKAWIETEETQFAWDSGLLDSVATPILGDDISAQLAETLISMYSYEGETVLDPFLGNGTISRAAALLNRRSVGYEINPYNLHIIKRKTGIPEKHLKVVFQGEARLT